MSRDVEHFSSSQREMTHIRKRRKRALILFVFVVALVFLASLFVQKTLKFESEIDHFQHGSIGSETRSGLPRDFWLALPHLYPEAFDHRPDFRAFGFLYRTDSSEHSLPIGVSQRRVTGIDMVWLNCASCHTGSYKTSPEGQSIIVPGMPANQLELSRFTKFVLSISNDELEADKVFDAMEKAGQSKNWIERQFWRIIVLPRIRSGLDDLNNQLSPLLIEQPDWGIGRVDTFNPYKMTQFDMKIAEIELSERVGASDFPSIFNQKPREGMQLHWDGNNASLKERNLSAALGAGVFPDTVDHRSVNRVAEWLLQLSPPRNPNRPDPGQAYSSDVRNGQTLYMSNCAACHGYFDLDKNSYIFEGEFLGYVEPIEKIDTDRNRLDSYTEAFRDRQLNELFAGTEHQFKEFTKTNGYANGPLDGLWLRGPYLHNGSVPTLFDLLNPKHERPTHFMRDSNVLDFEKGGFISNPCIDRKTRNCFDTNIKGNSNRGHEYGTQLSENERRQILEYLKTF